MTKIISHENIVDLCINPEITYHWVNETLKNKNSVLLPTKLSMVPDFKVFYEIMPSTIPYLNAAGVKVITRYPKRVPMLDSEIQLYNLETGKLDAILDGNYITALRTGAIAAHSVKLFARKNFSSIALIGLGNQAKATMKVLLSIYEEHDFKIKLYEYKNHHVEFKEYLESLEQSNRLNIEFCKTHEEVIKESDIVISSLTYAPENFCSDECYKKGVLVIPIHYRGFGNCELSFDKVYTDDINHVRHFENYNQFPNLAETSDVVNKINKGRESENERIIVYNVGLSIHDIVFAKHIYDMFLDLPSKDFTLSKLHEKIWFK